MADDPETRTVTSVRRWPAFVAVVVTLVLYLALPHQLVIGPRWMVPLLEVLLLIPLTIDEFDRKQRRASLIRTAVITLVALLSAANLTSLGLLVHYLVTGGPVTGRTLVLSAIVVWGTSVIVFSLWYWELDGGGPSSRFNSPECSRDFLFTQQANPEMFRGWAAGYFDYLYTSFTNSTAFSPTDTMPLTTWAKLLMMTQSAGAFITVALVAARAINILN